jgi:hypothetical protein
MEGPRIQLTWSELNNLANGTELHFTNWPGTPSVPVIIYWSEDGNIVLPNGGRMFAMADELTWIPRAGLEIGC